MLTIKSYAKLNLALNVIGVDPKDKYHLLEMVNVPLLLADTLQIEIVEGESFITCNNADVPLDKSNLVFKAISLMKERYNIKENFHVHIEKVIPMGAGLAGGSSNAAAVINGINELLELNISKEELAKEGMKVGADVAYCIYSQPALVEGKGEKINLVELNDDYYVLLIKPNFGLSTKEVYTLYDDYSKSHLVAKADIHQLVKVLQTDDEVLLKQNLINNLEISAFNISPKVKEIKESLIKDGLDLVLMTGSGSTIFALSKDKEKLEKIRTKYKVEENFVIVTKFKK